MKKLVMIILAAAMLLPLCALAAETTEPAVVPAIGRDAAFTQGLECIIRDIKMRTEGPTVELKTNAIIRLVTTDAYDQAQLSIAVCVDGEEPLAAWLEELPDGRGSITFKHSKYRSTIDTSVHDALYQTISQGAGEYEHRPLQALLKDVFDAVKGWKGIQDFYMSLSAADPGSVSCEFLDDGSIRISVPVASTDTVLEETLEFHSYEPDGPLFDLSDLIPEPFDLEANPYVTKDGMEVLQGDMMNWLMHDPDYLQLSSYLIPLTNQQEEEEQSSDEQAEVNFRGYMEQAEDGDAYSMYAVAYFYYYGLGTAQDFEQALAWARKGDEAGSPDAASLLGYMYDTGEGVPQDFAKAAEYYQRAADLGNGYAAYNLAMMYVRGDGVEEDPEKVKELLVQSAQAGCESAVEYIQETCPELLDAVEGN